MSTVQTQTRRAGRAAQRSGHTQRIAVDAGGPAPAQLRLAQTLNSGVSAQRLAAIQRMLDGGAAAQREGLYDEEDLAAQMKSAAQRENIYDEEMMAQMKPVTQREDLYDEEDLAAQMKSVAQRADAGAAASGGAAAATGGLSAPLRSGIEGLSGIDVSDVRVHRNSTKPESIGALAYAQGSDIYLGAGQERHLPHEAWHVVQQRQGRVNATMQFNGTAINDSPALEREADVMGDRAMRDGRRAGAAPQADATTVAARTPIAQGKVVSVAASATAGSLLQRKIIYNTTTNEYETDGKRAGWRSFLKESTASELGVSKSANFTTLGYDRAHRIPYAALETLVADYCNRVADDDELIDLTDSLYDTSTDEYSNMVSARGDLMSEQGGAPDTVRLYANYLLGLLNSATLNVSPGGFSENRGIQDRADYGYQMSPGGTNVELTPRSQQVYSMWSLYDRDPTIPMSPGGEHIRSSQMSSLQHGGTEVKFEDVNWK